MGRKKLLFLLILLNTSIYAREAHKEFLPKWELGLGLFAFRLNDYRGSDQSHSYYWPIPYVIYRGKHLEIENSTIKGQFIDSGRFRMGLSLMASVRINSTKNKAREGMPGKDPTFEAGPYAAYDFYVSESGKLYTTVGAAIRGAFAAEFFYVDHFGYFTVPYVSLSLAPQEITLGHYMQFSAALMFADDGYHGYFYDVEGQYATAKRPEYHSKSGFSGWHVTYYMSKKIHPIYYYAFARYDNLNHAVFHDSPLVKKKDYVAIGFGFIWYFLKSSEKSEIKYIEK